MRMLRSWQGLSGADRVLFARALLAMVTMRMLGQASTASTLKAGRAAISGWAPAVGRSRRLAGSASAPGTLRPSRKP